MGQFFFTANWWKSNSVFRLGLYYMPALRYNILNKNGFKNVQSRWTASIEFHVLPKTPNHGKGKTPMTTSNINEPPHDKINKIGSWGPKCFFMRTAKTLIRLGGCPGWSESSLDAQFILLLLLCGGSNQHKRKARRTALFKMTIALERSIINYWVKFLHGLEPVWHARFTRLYVNSVVAHIRSAWRTSNTSKQKSRFNAKMKQDGYSTKTETLELKRSLPVEYRCYSTKGKSAPLARTLAFGY